MRLANFKWACFNRIFFFLSFFFPPPLKSNLLYIHTLAKGNYVSWEFKGACLHASKFYFFLFVCFLEKEFDHSLEITANYHFPPSPVQSKLDKLKQGLEAEATWLQI